MKLITRLVPRWLQRYSDLLFDNSLWNEFKMLLQSLNCSLIGRLDLNSKAAQQSIVGRSVQKQPITERESYILRCDWLKSGCWTLTFPKAQY